MILSLFEEAKDIKIRINLFKIQKKDREVKERLKEI